MPNGSPHHGAVGENSLCITPLSVPHGITGPPRGGRKHTPGRDDRNFASRHLAYFWHAIKVTLFSSYANFLLVMVPIGIVAGKLSWNSSFPLNFFAIIPLTGVMSFAAEQISLSIGKKWGRFLNAASGDAVELIISIVALKEMQIDIVQACMLGSILSNLLLVMGMCFLFGGVIHRGSAGNGREQVFCSATAQTTCSLMTLSSASLMIPGGLHAVLNQRGFRDKDQRILALSRGTACILPLLYVLYLVFQHRTHSNLFEAENQDYSEHEEHEAPKEPILDTVSATVVLVVTIILTAICANYLVGGIDNLVETSGINRDFVSLILIPIVGNATQLVAAVIAAIQDKMDRAIDAAIGSSIRIALLFAPFLVILGWFAASDMSLHFEDLHTVAFAVSVLFATRAVQDGKSNYFEGALLLGLYAIIALALFVSPSRAVDGNVAA